MSVPEAKRILVYRVGHLGDTIVALPAFWAIRKAYPDAHIALMGNSAPAGGQPAVIASAVLPEKGLFDEFISYASSASGIAQVGEMLKTARTVRRGAFDAVFYLMTRNRPLASVRRDEIFFRVCGVQEVLGVEHLKRNLLNFEDARPLREVSAESEFLVETLKEIGIPVGSSDAPGKDLLGITKEESEFAKEWLRERAGERYGTRKIVGVGPGSKWDSKVWPYERFRAAVLRLIEERNVYPVVLGGPEDTEKAKRLVDEWGVGATAAGEFTVRQSGALLSMCSLYLGNDTGTMHLGAAAGVRCVAVFAAVDYPGRWAPMGTGHKVFRVAVPCEGCHSPLCHNDALCLKAVDVDSVVQACTGILDE